MKTIEEMQAEAEAICAKWYPWIKRVRVEAPEPRLVTLFLYESNDKDDWGYGSCTLRSSVGDNIEGLVRGEVTAGVHARQAPRGGG